MTSRLNNGLVDDSDLNTNGKLLSDKQIKKIKQEVNKLKIDLSSEFEYIPKRKLTIAQSGLKKTKSPYSIISSNNHLYAVYHGLNKGKHLGKGSSGVVKLMQDLETGEWLALKVQSAQKKFMGKLSADPVERQKQEKQHAKVEKAYQDKLHQETKITKKAGIALAAGITQNPNKKSKLKTIMKILPGIPLDRYLNFCQQQGNRLNRDKQFDLAIQLFDKVHEMHKKGIAHGDIQSDNIMYDVSNNNLVIFDFGVSIEKNDQNNSYFYNDNIQKDLNAIANVLCEVFDLKLVIDGSELENFHYEARNPDNQLLNRTNLNKMSTVLKELILFEYNPSSDNNLATLEALQAKIKNIASPARTKQFTRENAQRHAMITRKDAFRNLNAKISPDTGNKKVHTQSNPPKPSDQKENVAESNEKKFKL